MKIRHRSPGLPLIFALLKYADVERFYSLLSSIVLFAFFVSLYQLLGRFLDCRISIFTTLTFFFCFKLHSVFDFVLADGLSLTL